MDNYLYGGFSSVGYSRELNEDYISATELDDNTLFVLIADGAGSKTSSIQPASIVGCEIEEIIKREFAYNKQLLLENAELFLKEAMLSANRVLGAFKRANEELYSGFGASVSCCLLWENRNFCYAHTGNTRIYLIRRKKDGVAFINQLTVDQTKARSLLDRGLITPEQYHTHPDNLSITGGLGIALEPEIYTYTDELKSHDFLLMTTDGIHYAIKPEPMSDIVILSGSCNEAATALIEAAKLQKYPDNMSAMIIWAAK